MHKGMLYSLMLEKYHDLKQNLRQFGSFKILSLREGWSFQTRKTEPTCESWGALSATPGGAAAAGERAGGAASSSSAAHTSYNPAEQPPEG